MPPKPMPRFRVSSVRPPRLPAILACPLLLPFCAAGLSAEPAPSTTVAIYRESAVRFVDRPEATELVARPDPFLEGLSRFDLQARLNTDRPVTTADYVAMTQAELLDWTAEEKQSIGRIVSLLKPLLDRFDLPLPDEVLLVKYTGRGEAGAAYTRGDAIVLPRRWLQAPAEDLQRLLLHELFHVISRRDEDLRRELYAVIGFLPCDPIELPPAVADLKISNPDAPTIDYYILLSDAAAVSDPQRRSRAAVPVLLADSPYDPERGGTFFDYLRFKLMEIHRQRGRWRAVTTGDEHDQPVLISPEQAESFHRQIGRNTGYIIHPDEILADNFVFLVLGRQDLPSPEIVERMRHILTPPAERRSE